MCYYRLHIFTICGHTVYSPNPVRHCRDSTLIRTKLMTHSALTYWSGCSVRNTHPFHTVKVERLCVQCQTRRDALVQSIDRVHVIKVDDARWKVSYAGPEAVWDPQQPKLGLLESVKRRERLARTVPAASPLYATVKSPVSIAPSGTLTRRLTARETKGKSSLRESRQKSMSEVRTSISGEEIQTWI